MRGLRRRQPVALLTRLRQKLVDLGVLVTTRISELDGWEAEAAQDRARWRGRRRAASGQPEIMISGRHRREITADALGALRRANADRPTFFNFGGALARVRAASPSVIEVLSADALSGVLDWAADFTGVDRDGFPYPARPPRDVVADLLSLRERELPRLRRIVTTPVFVRQPDGGARLLDTPGFDAECGLYLDLSGLGDIDLAMDPSAALQLLLDDFLGDFPFADKASRAHALALLLQPDIRELYDGPSPGHLVEAPMAGTGKTLFVEGAILLATGEPAHPMTVPRDDSEMEKQLIAALLAGHPFMFFDNLPVDRTLDSAALSRVLTSVAPRGRRLGVSEIVTVPNFAAWPFTANNPNLSLELKRRLVSSRLDSGAAHAEHRTGWRHDPFLGWVRANRARLVVAKLSLVGMWVAAGMPNGSAALGMFEGWSAAFGGLLGFLGVEGFLGDRDRLDRETDRESSEWEEFFKRWWAAYRDQPIVAGQAVAVAKGGVDGVAPLLLDVWGGRTALGASQRVADALRQRRDRRFGEWFLRAAGQGPTGGTAYRLKPVGETSPRGGAGSGNPDGRAHPAAAGPVETPETPETPTANSHGPISEQEIQEFQEFQEDPVRVPADTSGAPEPAPARWDEAL